MEARPKLKDKRNTVLSITYQLSRWNQLREVKCPVKTNNSKTTRNLGIMCKSLVRGHFVENSKLHFEVLHFDSSASPTQ